MIDRENVIKELTNLPTTVYCGFYQLRITHELRNKVIALLKEQEPRVMAPTEAYTEDFVYIEFDGVITPALRTSKEREGYRESYFATQQLGGEWMRWDDYGITWRCWTSRPTDEQRRTVKWNV